MECHVQNFRSTTKSLYLRRNSLRLAEQYLTLKTWWALYSGIVVCSCYVSSFGNDDSVEPEQR